MLAAWVPAPTPAAAARLPPQGVYEQCPPSSPRCDDRLAAIAAAGFRLVLNYRTWEGSPRDLRRYARRARTVGVRLILPLNDPAWRLRRRLTRAYPRLTAGSTCRTGRCLRRYALRVGDGLPAVWGWYVGDELRPREATRVASLAGAVRTIDPLRPRLFVGYRDPDRRDDRRLAPFAPSADVLAYASYPVGLGSPLEAVGHAAGEARAIARATGDAHAAVIQAFDWRRYGVTRRRALPTIAQMRTMRDLALQASPSLLLWYSWQDVLRARRPDLRLAALRAAAFAPPP